jgi:hypothetical protein
MAHNDFKYTSYLDIAQRLAKTHPNKSNLLQPQDVASWCAEVETQMIGDIEAFRTYVDQKFIVSSNRQVLVPCNVYKILDVFRDPGTYYSRIDYYNNGSYLNFSTTQTFPKDTDGNDVIYINYKGIAVDSETHYPLIKKGHERACEAYCMTKIYYEDFLNGKINIQAWSELHQELDNALLTAKRPFKDMDNQKMLEIQYIRSNMVFKPYSIPIYNMNY